MITPIRVPMPVSQQDKCAECGRSEAPKWKKIDGIKLCASCANDETETCGLCDKMIYISEEPFERFAEMIVHPECLVPFQESQAVIDKEEAEADAALADV